MVTKQETVACTISDDRAPITIVAVTNGVREAPAIVDRNVLVTATVYDCSVFGLTGNGS